jgi:predicted transposase/invertase (TIGR01784 family)
VKYAIIYADKDVKPMKIEHKSLIGTYEQKKAQVQGFNLMHDDFFAVVMQHKEAIEVALRILLKKKTLKVKEVRIQYAVRNIIGHSAALDALAEDSDGKLYNIEVQVKNEDDYQKRVRYYQANTDISFLNKGKHYKDLPELYLIFISSFDIFDKNEVCYEIQRVLKGHNEVVENGVHELYFNTKVKDDTEISKLLQYFRKTNIGNKDFGMLSQTVDYYKNTEEGVSHVCDEVRRYGDERAKEASEYAKAEEQVQMINSIMTRKGIALESALDMTGVTMEEYIASLTLLNETEKV